MGHTAMATSHGGWLGVQTDASSWPMGGGTNKRLLERGKESWKWNGELKRKEMGLWTNWRKDGVCLSVQSDQLVKCYIKYNNCVVLRKGM